MPDGEREALDWTFRPRVSVRPLAVQVAMRYLSSVVNGVALTQVV
jgi:hypothetical protein